jgi:hypothetical protein
MIAARRPNSPVILSAANRSKAAASAKPKSLVWRPEDAPEVADARKAGTGAPAPQRRVARIVQLDGKPLDERELERRKLLQRLIESEGRSQVSRAAEAYLHAGFEFPKEQEVQLQLLEHFNETRAREAIAVLLELVDREDPKKRPVFEQRLRRLEEYADEDTTRQAAAALRRAIRA